MNNESQLALQPPALNLQVDPVAFSEIEGPNPRLSVGHAQLGQQLKEASPTSPEPPESRSSAGGLVGVGVAVGAPKWVLRAEGAAALVGSASAFWALGGSGWLFAVLFLAPDLSLFGFLRSERLGVVLYNISHSYFLAALLAGAGVVLGVPSLWLLALIWAAHIGFDRMLGFGLKYTFRRTHLGEMRSRSAAE